MALSELTTDYWEGRDLCERTFRVPSWDDLQIAIEELDDKHKTLVAATAPGDPQLLIGGGDGRFVVCIGLS